MMDEKTLKIAQSQYEVLKKVEEAKLELQHHYSEKRLKLLADNKTQVEWMLESLHDLRKERIKFQKKSLPEIAEALKEGNIPDDLVKDWLGEISRAYHHDLTLAQTMISIDLKEVDSDIFDASKKKLEGMLHDYFEKQTAETISPKTTRIDEHAGDLEEDPT